MPSPLTDLASLIARGGPVMWPLLALSVISLAMTLERTLFWLRAAGPARRNLAERITDALTRADHQRARAIASKHPGIVAEAARFLLDARPHDALAVEAAERFRHRAERFAPAMTAITAGAPLLGILGTVLGIISSFDLLGQSQGVTDVADVAAGIAEALLTTAFGLVVALITLFPAALFRARADRFLSAIEMIAAARLANAPNHAHATPEPAKAKPETSV